MPGLPAAPEYEYKPLFDSQCIRLLTLDPGKPDDPLKGELEVVRIASSGEYEPLSYVWGKAEHCHHITIRDDEVDRRLELTDSLHGALRQIRYTDRKRRLWADQICIYSHRTTIKHLRNLRLGASIF